MVLMWFFWYLSRNIVRRIVFGLMPLATVEWVLIVYLACGVYFAPNHPLANMALGIVVCAVVSYTLTRIGGEEIEQMLGRRV